jgi:hypothetical protein
MFNVGRYAAITDRCVPALTAAARARNFFPVLHLTKRYYSWQPLNVEAGD